MDPNQLIKALGDAAVNAKPAQEYCLFWWDWWPMCMTKGEWSGWMQAIGSIVTVGLAVYVPYAERRRERRQDIEKSLASAKLWFGRNKQTLDSLVTIVNILNDEVSKDKSAEEVTRSVELFRDNFSQIVVPEKNELLNFESLSFPGDKGIDPIGVDFYQAYSSFLNSVNTQLLWLEKVKYGDYKVPNIASPNQNETGVDPILKSLIKNNLVVFTKNFELKVNSFRRYLELGVIPVGLEGCSN